MIKDILGYIVIIGIILMFANGLIFKPLISAIKIKQYKALLVFFDLWTTSGILLHTNHLSSDYSKPLTWVCAVVLAGAVALSFWLTANDKTADAPMKINDKQQIHVEK